MGFRVVKPQRQTLDVYQLVRAFDIHFFDLRPTVQILLTNCGPVEFHPFGGAGEPPLQSFQVELPRANEEVKIVLPISLAGHALWITTRVLSCHYSRSLQKKQRSYRAKDEQGFV